MTINDLHEPGHQQALLKNKICIAVLSFPEHDLELMAKTFYKFEYDEVIDLCPIQQSAWIDSFWNGTLFSAKPFDSWVLTDSGWAAPKNKPSDGKDYYWDEENISWVLYESVEDITGN